MMQLDKIDISRQLSLWTIMWIKFVHQFGKSIFILIAE